MTPRLPRPVLLLALVAALLPASARADAAVRVYPLGDSITYGATVYLNPPGTLVNTPGGYRGGLDALLTANGVAHTFVGSRNDNSTPVLDATGENRHDGWPGWRIDQIDSSVTGWINGGVSPDVVVIHLGTNDIGQRWDPATTFPTGDGRVDYNSASQRATFVADMTARLGGLVDRLQALRPGVRIVLSDVVPWASTDGTGAPLPVTAEYATSVATLAANEAATGAKVVFADVWTPFVAATPAGPVVVPGLIATDNVHPTPAGYTVMATVYDAAVRAVLAA